MTRAAIYARFSSSRQREESIEDQVRVCREYADAHDMAVMRVYTDEARSGTEAEHRPGFQHMIADAGRGKFDAVLVYKVDRFARNRYDSARYKYQLRKVGVRLLSATEGVPDGPEGIIMESLLEGMAEYYSANLSQNIKRGIHGNALKCRHNGHKVFGYLCGEDGRFHPDPATAPAVEAAYRAAAAGETMAEIARSLNGGGFRTIRGGMWDIKNVGRMLRSDRYRGVYRYAGVEVEGGMPAIVDRALWDAAVSRIGSTGGRRKGAEEASYLLSGVFFDEDGNRLTPNCGRSHTGAVHRYYRSRRTGRSVRRDEADARTRRAVAALLADGSNDQAIVDAVMACQESLMADELAAISSLRSRIAQVERERANLVELAAKTGAEDFIAARIMEASAELDGLRAELATAEASAPTIEEDYVRFFLHKLRTCTAPDAIVRGFVTRVVWIEPDQMRVEFLMDRLTAPAGLEDIAVKCNKPAGEPAGLSQWHRVETRPDGPNPSRLRLWGIPGGFAIAA